MRGVEALSLDEKNTHIQLSSTTEYQPLKNLDIQPGSKLSSINLKIAVTDFKGCS